jgi:hypothetical protein
MPLKRRHYAARVIILLAAIALIVWLVSWLAAPYFEIRDWHDLNAVRDNLRGHYILMNDLDSTTAGYTELASPTANGGKGWRPIRGFTGTFDGQGYEIRDLFINRPDETYAGLFGTVYERGHIEDIGVVNATVTGNNAVGAIVGRLAGYNGGWSKGGSVSNSYSNGNITGNQCVGGLVGFSYGPVSNSYSASNVTGTTYYVGGLVGANSDTVSNSYAKGNVTGNVAVGSLVGANGGTVSNSYAKGNVIGLSDVGGLVGRNGGIVSNSYSSGNVTGSSSVGGLVGANWTGGTVSDSSWDTETSGQSTSAGGTGKNTTEMRDITTFSGVGWNIIAVASPGMRNPSYIWNIVNGLTYPFLNWQS